MTAIDPISVDRELNPEAALERSEKELADIKFALDESAIVAITDQLRPQKALVLDALKNGRARGNGQMAAGLYTGQDAEDVASYVAKASGAGK